jgi:predicted DNA-binding ribbon-helix-helix protein
VAQEYHFVLLNGVRGTVAFEKRYWSCLVSI